MDNEVELQVVAIVPTGGQWTRIAGRGADGQPRGLRIDADHLLLSFVRAGERWAFFVAADGETVTGGGFRGEVG